MAKCGCSSGCNCSVVAGTGTTVTGVGTAANPYVINATGGQTSVLDTATVDMTLTGTGAAGDPYVISSAVKISAVAGNVLTAQADGLAVTCEDIQDCVGAGFEQGLIYDDAANAFRARIDPAPGNTITQSAAGLLVTAGAATVTTADTPCIAVNGDGSLATPITAVPILDPVAGNLLTCGAAGLSVTCEAVQDCVGAGFVQGLQYDDANNQFLARIDPAPGNAVVQSAAGLFVATGGGATVVTADTPCIAVNGDGSGATPITAVPILDPAATNLLTCTASGMAVLCEAVQDCVGAGFVQGLQYDDANNQFLARIDPVAGNTITQSAAGLLVTPAAVTAGCGLTGAGTVASPLIANVAAWPFACPQNAANATEIFCDPATGQLQGEPPQAFDFQQQFINLTFANVAVPAAGGAGTLIPGGALNLNVVNPSPCRSAFVMVELEEDVDFTLPTGAAAEMMIDADVMYRIHNPTGTGTQTDVHAQGTKVVSAGTLAPGGNTTIANEARLRNGTNGATYSRLQFTGRAWVITI